MRAERISLFLTSEGKSSRQHSDKDAGPAGGAREDQILALPTVVRRWPLPKRRASGRRPNTESLLAALELRAAQESGAGTEVGTPRR